MIEIFAQKLVCTVENTSFIFIFECEVVSTDTQTYKTFLSQTWKILLCLRISWLGNTLFKVYPIFFCVTFNLHNIVYLFGTRLCQARSHDIDIDDLETITPLLLDDHSRGIVFHKLLFFFVIFQVRDMSP